MRAWTAALAVTMTFCFACGGGGGGTGGGSGGGGKAGGSGGAGGSAGAGGSGGNAGGSAGAGGGDAGGSAGAGGGATGGGSAGGGTGGGSTGTVTVMGRVLNNGLEPQAGATVVIIGKPSTTTDTMGRFTITGVTTPYTIATVTSSGTTFVAVYVGMTRNDPTLVSNVSGSAENMATVTGTLSGTGVTFPTPVGRASAVAFDAPEARASGAGISGPAYSQNVLWRGAVAVTGLMHALQWTRNASGLPTAYNGYGSLSGVTIAAGNTAMNKDVTLNAPQSQTLMGTASAPTNYTIGFKSLSLVFQNRATISLVEESANTAAFSYATPVIPNTTLTASVLVSGMGAAAGRLGAFSKQGLAANASGVTLTAPTAPGLSLPANNATGIALGTQSFSWSDMAPAGLYSVSVVSSGRRFGIITAQSSFVLPPTSELGLGTIPAGTVWQWRVAGYGGGATTVDAVAGPNATTALQPTTGDAWLAQSENRQFTNN